MPLPWAAVGRFVPDQRPARHVDVGVLPVGVVSEQELRVLPAVEARHLAEWGLDRGGQTFALPVAPVCALDVSGLDFAAVVDNGTSGIDE